MNAWVSGTTKWLRVVFITDALLSQLTMDEVLTVFAHELGHVHKRHLLLNLCCVIALISVLSWVSTLLPPLNSAVAAVGRGGIIGLMVVLVFNAISRRFEYEADRYAWEITNNKEAYISALRKLANSRGLWGQHSVGLMAKLQTHPTFDQRVQRINDSVSN